MFKSLFSRKGPAGLCGLQIQGGNLLLAFVSGAGERIALDCCEVLEAGDSWSGRAELLAQKVRESGLAQARCNLVLTPEQYQLFMMEAPKVPAEELREAVKWKVKDLVSEPLDQVVIDVMSLADDCGRAGQRLIYAVVAKREFIEAAIALVEKSGLVLESIDIDEMAVRNLGVRLAADKRGVALVVLRQGQGSLALVKEQQLYLSRSFTINYAGGLLDDIPEEALILELQRSFDYYERQLGQVPPATIVLMGEHVTSDKLQGQLADAFGAQVQTLDIARWLEDNERYDELVLQQCASALGAALRSEEAV
ncbi:type IV pilus biogenesis protein PilM [Simiduia agarivorans]|uniref:MSHA biogenesis protein MshI n=1 Tax=Simiduia agarivorans (strain DSM 21679 / JCM 13881 / BCRC 17597 / SA1) TaxID=1117647 RepID=K4KVU5_SIMAS|nr:putative MSHA biogenesis protein MshI [Simiduia agarivorans]AFU98062.1 putative MSHA biogenesis protein MshI [Simiduia agarivorans SA1 = DSM 21679]